MKKARWIWKGSDDKTDEHVVFDLKFGVPAGKRVFMDVSVFGEYALYVGEKLAAFGQYADYAHYKVYDTVELTDFSAAGDNDFRLVCRYSGISSSVYIADGKGAMFEIYDESGNVLCFSDAGTRCALAPDYVSYENRIITGQLGLSCTYDSRGKDATPEWESAVLCGGTKSGLHKRPNKKTVLNKPAYAKLISAEKKLYDLGRECCGFLTIEFKAAEGKRFSVAYGEHIQDGGVRHYIDGRNFTVDVIGNGKTVFYVGPFRRLGCRYLQILGNAEIVKIGISEVEYPFEKKPFPIADAKRKKIYDTSVRTLELCAHEHYEDCPWREQAMYIMDSRNQMRCGYYAFDNAEFAEASIKLMLQGQREDGLFDLCFPAKIDITIPSFSLTFPSVVYEYAAYVKSDRIIKESFGKIEKTMNYFLSRIDESGLYRTVSEDGIWHFYEWCGDLDGAIYNPDMTKIERDEYDCLINAYISIACGVCEKLCAVIGNFTRLHEYETVRAKLNGKIVEKFYDAETGLFRTKSNKDGYSELANALCVLCGAADAEKAASIADKLAFGYDGWLRNTLSMNLFRYDALLKVNREKYADAILKEIDETYGYMLDCGATSFWETIKGADDFHGAGSLCHGWSAIPAYYYRVLCGNEPTLDKAFDVADSAMRNDYAASAEKYVKSLFASCEQKRDRYLNLSENEKRKEFVKMLGFPLTDKKEWKARLVKTEKLLQTDVYTATRYCFDVNGIAFGGILYESADGSYDNEKDAFVFALHGGDGSSEIVGDLFIGSANYNCMVKRLVRKGVKVFAPQLLLWSVSAYGSPYDRAGLNRSLTQLGGSITALELKILSALASWFEPLVDADRMGVLGLSYGGMYALHFGALDKRMKATYSSCWFNDRAKHNWYDWVYFGAAKKMFDAEVASLVFPRRLYIEIATRDEVFPAADAEKECARLKNYAEKAGVKDLLDVKIFDGVHELDTDGEMIENFVKYLCSRAK